MSGTVYGVGVGPGDPLDLTLKALETLKKVHTIILPSSPKEDCEAYKVIKAAWPEVDTESEIVCDFFSMSRSKEAAAQRHEEIYQRTLEYICAGKDVAFPAIGDVCLYSTYFYIHEKLLKNGYKSVLINGLSSVQTIAAQMGISLAQGDENCHIIGNLQNVNEALALPGTLVFMKSGSRLQELVSALKIHALRCGAIKIYGISNQGKETEICANNIDELEKLSGYFTTIIVKNNPGIDTSSFFANTSCKYYPCHQSSEELNCLFCYCPMYRFKDCLGNPEFIEKPDGIVKNCSHCDFPHQKDNYESIMNFLKTHKYI